MWFVWFCGSLGFVVLLVLLFVWFCCSVGFAVRVAFVLRVDFVLCFLCLGFVVRLAVWCVLFWYSFFWGGGGVFF